MTDDSSTIDRTENGTAPTTSQGSGNVPGSDDHWFAGDGVSEAELPEDVRTAFEQFFGGASIATIQDWTTEITRHTAGQSLAIEELCHADEETGHRGTISQDTYHFVCFYDAVLLAALADEPVDVRTESPGGTAIEARATGSDDLTVTPADAVVSFGIATDAEPSTDGGPTLEDAYAAICPYVKAFPDRAAYEQWAGTVPAATIAMPLSDATEVTMALAG
jgi:alkylmercury lyase